MAVDINKSPFTQSITKAAKIKFNAVANRFSGVAIQHDLNKPGSGVVLDKLIQKFSEQLTNEDFFPDLYKGNQLKQK